jgi:hypothetical protein
MIQRIQSVYLLLGALCLTSLALVDDIWLSQAAELQAWYVPAVAIVGIATVIAALTAIFLYKDRSRQLKFIVAVQLMTLAFLVILFGGQILVGDFTLLEGGTADVAMIIALVLPLAAYIFFYLARRGVRRDINLVKSIDRLR